MINPQKSAMAINLDFEIIYIPDQAIIVELLRQKEELCLEAIGHRLTDIWT